MRVSCWTEEIRWRKTPNRAIVNGKSRRKGMNAKAGEGGATNHRPGPMSITPRSSSERVVVARVFFLEGSECRYIYPPGSSNNKLSGTAFFGKKGEIIPGGVRFSISFFLGETSVAS